MYQRFVIWISQILILTIFSVFFGGRFGWKTENAGLQSHKNNELINKTYQFEENCAKIKDLRLPHCKTYKKGRYDVIE